MERNVSFEEISDGKRYHNNDMAKLGCNDCEGCSACCRGMGESIVLDPWDIYMLMKNLNVTFENLMEDKIELNVVAGMILPNLKLSAAEEGCNFLSEAGRCTIHGFRPGICRLFPLGRIYEEESFTYFLQTKECHKENRTKVKINKWLGIPELEAYETFITEWHYFTKDFQYMAKRMPKDLLQRWNLFLLQTFYVNPYVINEENSSDNDLGFYQEFHRRLTSVKKQLKME